MKKQVPIILEHTPAPTVKHARILLKLAIAAILLTAFGLWFWEKQLIPLCDKLPWLRIEEVQIHSEWPLTAATVKGWLPPLEGKNIAAVRADALVQLLQAKPWVESVTIKKEFPNRISLDIGTKRAEAVAIVRGLPFFLDSRGQTIEHATPGLLRALDLPIISVERESDLVAWPMTSAMTVLSRFRLLMDPRYNLSQVVLGAYPYFKIFLAQPRIEVSFNYESWETQLPILTLLLHRPPDLVGQTQRISLVFPKKAIVTPSTLK